jgi:arylsulfatase A-like enzyme
MTGVSPTKSGVYSNFHDWRINPVTNCVPTLPEFLRGAGYSVKGGGKIFHALEWFTGDTDGFNDSKCWDEYFPSISRQMPQRILPDGDLPLVKRGRNAKGEFYPLEFFDWGPLGKTVEEMPDHKVIDSAINELGDKHEKPFFLAVGIFRPHIPWYVPQEFFDLYPVEDIELPYVKQGWLNNLPTASRESGAIRRHWHNWVLENEEWEEAIQGYLASVSYADYELGRLLDNFRESQYYDNTIVILWTDHGFHLGDKDTWEKFTLWEESTKVPLIIRIPNVTDPGSQCAQPASLLDLYPTIVDILGEEPLPHLDGVSLLPQLLDVDTKRKEPAICTNEWNNHSIRSERFHYIRYANGDEELYDHYVDEGEWDNLAKNPEYQDVIRELRTWLPTENAEPQKQKNEEFQFVFKEDSIK